MCRQQSRSRERSRGRREERELPALVRDHAVLSTKRTGPGEEKKAVEAEEEHVDVSISSITNRKFSQSSSSVGSSNNSTNNSLRKPPINRKLESNSSSEVITTARRAEQEECFFSSSDESLEEERLEEGKVVEERKVVEENKELTKEEKDEDERKVVADTIPGDNLVRIKQKLMDQTKVKPSEYVGFSKLPYQVYRRALLRGFKFNLLVVGESGLGKSSLINSMFWTDLLKKDDYEDLVPGVIQSSEVSLQEGEVRLDLNILHLPGYGDNIDNTQCWEPIREFISAQFESYLQHETRVDRRGLTIPDTRLHACLYFISPVGHGLKPLDIEFMKTFQDSVNIIPILAKADTYTAGEQKLLKNKVMFSNLIYFPLQLIL